MSLQQRSLSLSTRWVFWVTIEKATPAYLGLADTGYHCAEVR